MLIEEWRRIPKTLAFDKSEYQTRRQRLCAAMAERGLDALWLHSTENLCYLTGFQTPGYYFVQSLLINADGDMRLVTRYLEQTNAFAFTCLAPEIFRAYPDEADPATEIVAAIRELGLDRAAIGVEMEGYSVLPIATFERVRALLPDNRFQNGSGLVEQLRMVKSPAEIAHIRASCTIASAGMKTAVENCCAGISEHELAAEIERTTTALGSSYPGLPLFLSSGDRTFIRHAVPSSKRIERGDNVLVELTGVVWRYAGPLFRTLSVGPPCRQLRAHSDAANSMLDAVLENLRPGTTSHEVNTAVIAAACAAGVDAGVTKRAGYSVGLNFPPDWGEGVFLDLCNENRTVIRPGMVFHCPQAMRIGDSRPTTVSESILVTEGGCEALTSFAPRDLIVID